MCPHFLLQFLCDEGSGDYISRIDEPESCVYILTVHTTKICHHPYLKPLSPSKPLPITCHPVLEALQYQEYLDDQEGNNY
jgi:protein OS-9